MLHLSLHKHIKCESIGYGNKYRHFSKYYIKGRLVDQRNEHTSLSTCGFTQDTNCSELNLMSLHSFSLLVLYHLTSSFAPIIIAAAVTRVCCQVNSVPFNLLKQTTIVAIVLVSVMVHDSVFCGFLYLIFMPLCCVLCLML